MEFFRKLWARLNSTKAPKSLAKNALPQPVGQPLACPCGGKPLDPNDRVVCPECSSYVEGGITTWNRMVQRLDTLSDCCKMEENIERLDQKTGPLVRCKQCNRHFYALGVK